MRLRIRSRPRGETRAEREPLPREAPPSVLTTWLRQGLRDGICPLCRVAHKADREYIWHFYDEGSDQGESIDELRRSCGFCAQHIEMLRQIDVEAMKSTLAIATMFADVLAGVAEDLESQRTDASFERAACPACVNRDRHLRANAGYLLDELASGPGYRETFAQSPGAVLRSLRAHLERRPIRRRPCCHPRRAAQRHAFAVGGSARAHPQTRRPLSARAGRTRKRLLDPSDPDDQRLVAAGGVGGGAGVTAMRINVRAVIVHAGLLVVSRESRHGVTRPFLPGASVRDQEPVLEALTRGVRDDIGRDIVPLRLLYVAEVVGVYGVHDLNLVWLAELCEPIDGLATVALDGDRGYSVLPPLIEQIAADAGDEFDKAPRWLGNVGRSYL